jgi:hypothetical protein
LQLTGDAVAALQRAVECGDTKNEVRAAQVVLAQAVRAVETLDLAREISEIKDYLFPRAKLNASPSK